MAESEASQLEAAATAISTTLGAQQPKKKRLDHRVNALIHNAVTSNHRSFFVLVGDRGKNQVVNLHFLLSQARHSARPNVLWCYKKELGFTSNRKKREAKIKRDVKRGAREVGDMDPFELFVSVTDIRYTCVQTRPGPLGVETLTSPRSRRYYKDTHKILGQTFGMVVLQDFEALTPNLLARTIETVQGGGIVVLLLSTMQSLRQLYTMTMDVHARYRTEAREDVVARFNERFILSLGGCKDCLLLDDELNVLPLSAGKDVQPMDKDKGKGKEARLRDAELVSMKEELQNTHPIGDIVKHAKTVDQAKALLTFTEAITEKTLSSTVTLTAARGRGKSAALGLAVALAVAHSYSNIFVTSPSPENLKTFFEFLLKGFDALGYEEHLDYDVHQSTNPEWKGAVVRINIFRAHRQTIQYIQPQDAHVLGQAELLVIDEAAAIPLPLVKNLMGPYLVFMASTINGYEGTGRSLSLKLIQQLRELSRNTATAATELQDGASSKPTKSTAGSGSLTRSLREIKLDEPIRYDADDQVEQWLNQLLCLDATIVSRKSFQSGCPHPSQCELYHVNRDTLFSYHPASEVFLQRMMALYVASHYKNSPNDLQLMSDAPGHHLFVLLPPIREDDNTLPEPLVVLQVALEGQISKASILASLHRGVRAAGDLIPWTVSQQFQDDDFATLSGARVVRIAAHPDYAKMGYGTRALQALNSYYSGELLNADEALAADDEVGGDTFAKAATISKDASLQSDRLQVRDATRMPALLQRLSERRPEKLDYLGTSFGMTSPLLRFWKRSGYVPLYLRQTQNDLTGEHTCLMLRGLNSNVSETAGWLSAFAQGKSLLQRRKQAPDIGPHL